MLVSMKGVAIGAGIATVAEGCRLQVCFLRQCLALINISKALGDTKIRDVTGTTSTTETLPQRQGGIPGSPPGPG